MFLNVKLDDRLGEMDVFPLPLHRAGGRLSACLDSDPRVAKSNSRARLYRRSLQKQPSKDLLRVYISL